MEVNHELKCRSYTETFDFLNKLEGHTKKEHYFKCKECDDALATTEARESHMDQKHSSCEVYEVKKFSCEECDLNFTPREMLVQHMKRSHAK